MTDPTKVVEVNLGRQGRLVIPASLRRSLGLVEGDKLIAREEAGRLVLESRSPSSNGLKPGLRR
jgi:AbrB family looped-hinge helix DNA binding protein